MLLSKYSRRRREKKKKPNRSSPRWPRTPRHQSTERTPPKDAPFLLACDTRGRARYRGPRTTCGTPLTTTAPPPSPPPHPLASCRCDFCNATLLRSAPLLLLLWVCVICCYSALCAATFFYSCKREAAVAAGSAQRCCCVLFLFSCHAFALGTPCSSRIPDLHRRGGGHFLPLALALLCGCSRCIVSGGRMGALLCLVTFTSLPSPLRPAATQQARVGRAERHRHSLMMMSMGRGLHWQCVCMCVWVPVFQRDQWCHDATAITFCAMDVPEKKHAIIDAA